MLLIIDYGVGNLGSICNMFKKIGASPVVSAKVDDVRAADRLVLPGVGAFDSVMTQFRQSGVEQAVVEKALGERVPVLGICVGMQMLGLGSEEGSEPGLGWLDARCERFRKDVPGLRVPHMGWNRVRAKKPSSLTGTLPEDARFYFVHSYHMVCRDPADELLVANHGSEIVAAVQRDNIYGVQFHPEKSHRFGMELFRQFMTI
jgi:glutamine amidotransferase